MKLVSFKYGYPSAYSDKWLLNEVYLTHLNLIVGKNATGKSRAITVLEVFTRMIKNSSLVYIGNWEFNFQKSDQAISYVIKNDRSVLFEQVSINKKIVAKRRNSQGRLFSKKINAWQDVSPPDDRLLLHTRRDVDEYPYFEDIVTWCEGVHLFRFGHVHASSFIEEKESSIASIENIPELINKMTTPQLKKLLTDFNSLGYNISELRTKKEVDKTILFVKERLLKKEISQRIISQGMYRAIALLIFVHYLLGSSVRSSMILVDDLCEGLDYERATKLGKLLFKSLIPPNIQLVATSNDSFLMDVVPIKNWNVLTRKGSTVFSYNYEKDKEIFEKFKYSGLSNFDFFSSDYLLSADEKGGDIR